MKVIASIALTLLLGSVATAQNRPAEVDPQRVEEIKKGVTAKLLESLRDGRAWEPDATKDAHAGSTSQPWGASAAAANALLLAGEDPATNAKLAAAIDDISKASIKGVYALSLRMQLLNNPILKKKYDKVVDADFKLLADGINAEGMFTYTVGNPGQDMSCTYFGWCGLFERKQKITPAAWKLLVTRLLSLQVHDRDLPNDGLNGKSPAQLDGGWSYVRMPGKPPTMAPSIAMTAEATYMLLVARDNFKDKKVLAAIDKAVEDGMDFLKRNLEASKGESTYSVMALQRLAAMRPDDLSKTGYYAAAVVRMSPSGGAGGGSVGTPAMMLHVVAVGDPSNK
jgi:hypothetical protein